MLPGLTFIEPEWWGTILRSHQGVLEPAFWSLFVEMKFYFIFGAFYFWWGPRVAIWSLLVLSALSSGIDLLGGLNLVQTSAFQPLDSLLKGISANYFCWFAAGALFYQYFRVRSKAAMWSALIIAFVFPRLINFAHYLPSCAIIALFASSVISKKVQAILSWKPLLFLGFVSYPLYLLHENMMIAMIIKVGKFAPSLPALAMPLAPIVVLICLAWVSACYLEPFAKSIIKLLLLGKTTLPDVSSDQNRTPTTAGVN